MESTESGPTGDRLLDSVYLRGGAGLRRPLDSANLSVSHLQSTQGSFHLSEVQYITKESMKTPSYLRHGKISLEDCQYQILLTEPPSALSCLLNKSNRNPI